MANAQDFTIPDVHTFEQIVTRATETVSSGKKPRTALVVPSNISSLKALGMAIEKGLVDAILIGDEQLAKKNAAENDVNLDSAKFININEPDMAVKTAVKMACANELDILMSGRVPAVNLLQFILDKSAGFVLKGNTVSHVAVLKPALYEKLLFLTDAAVNMEPNLKTKLAIINNAVKVANLVGVDMPRVALIAAVEVIYPQMPVTMDAAIIAKMADRKQIKGAYVDGPLSFDVAVDMIAAHSKGIKDSKVAGQADILLAPNIETANGVYRAMSLYGQAEIGAIVYGGKVPVVLSSRSDSVESRFNSIILGVLAANGI